MRTSKITTALAVTALLVAVLGTTPLGHAAGSILPRNSVGTPQIKKGAVSSTKIHANSITGAKVVDGSLTSADLKPGTIPSATGKVPAARITRGSSNQTVPNATLTYVQFDTEAFDTADLFSPGAPGLRAPVAGLYLVTANVRWKPNANGERFVTLVHGSPALWIAPDWRNATGNGNSTDQSISSLVSLQAGEIVQLRVYQTSGAPLDLLWHADPDSNSDAPTMTMHYVGPAS